MKKVVVASTNPVKIAAIASAFRQMFPEEEWQCIGVATDSGVSKQPLGDRETKKGARNRIRQVRKSHKADFWAAVEGGCVVERKKIAAIAWIIIVNSDGKTGVARAAQFYLPKEIANLIHKGYELGDADDIVFGRTNSKQQNGSVGLLTGDMITRTDYYTHPAILALIPFRTILPKK
jgi:inosine/xanthosine triphosphatase